MTVCRGHINTSSHCNKQTAVKEYPPVNKMFFASLALATSISIASTANAVPISGLGDPLSNPALTGGTQEGFDSTAAGLYNSITIGNVTYSGVGAPLNIGADFNGGFNTTGGQSLFTGFDLDPDQIRFDFSSVVTAFGFNWGAADNTWLLEAFDAGGNLIESTLIGGTFFSNAGEFFGLSTGTAIAYALLTDQKDNPNSQDGDYVFIDRFTTNGGSKVVPLPAALPMLLAGLGGLGLLSFRRKSA